MAKKLQVKTPIEISDNKIRFTQTMYEYTTEIGYSNNEDGEFSILNTTEGTDYPLISVYDTLITIYSPDLLSPHIKTSKNSRYAALIPNTTSWTANKTIATEDYVDDAIAALPEPMIFKGSVGSGGTAEWANLPVPGSTNEGFTYKVITEHSTAPICKVGDTIISNGSSWIVIPSGDEPSGTVTSVGLSMPTGFSVSSGPVTSSGTLTATLNSGYELLNSNTAQTIAGAKTFTGSVEFNSESGAINSTTGYITSNGYYLMDSSSNVYQFIPDNTNHTIKVEIPTINPTTDPGGTIRFPRKSGTLAIDTDVLHKASVETITGTKIFQTDQKIKYVSGSTTLSTPAILFRDPADTVTNGAIGIGHPSYALGLAGTSGVNLIIGNSKDSSLGDSGGSGFGIKKSNTSSNTFSNIILDVSTLKLDITSYNSSGFTYSYLKLPNNRGSSSSPATLTTTDDLTGFVTGPSSAISGRIAVFDGTTGKLIRDNGGISISHSNPSEGSYLDTLYIGNLSIMTDSETSGSNTMYIGNVNAGYIQVSPYVSNNEYHLDFAAYADMIPANTSLGTSSSPWGRFYVNKINPNSHNAGYILPVISSTATTDKVLATQEYVDTNILPKCPTTTDGNYILRATVSNGEVTYTWVEDNFVRLS